MAKNDLNDVENQNVPPHCLRRREEQEEHIEKDCACLLGRKEGEGEVEMECAPSRTSSTNNALLLELRGKVPQKTCHEDPRYRIGAAVLVLFWAFGAVFSLTILPSLQGGGDANVSMQHQPVASLTIQDQISQRIGSFQLSNGTSPQHKALEWIVHEDPLQLPKSAPDLLQRYAMVQFYFSTTVSRPWKACNPSSSDNKHNQTCDFVKFLPLHPELTSNNVPRNRWLSDSHECEWAGVICDDWNEVSEIVMNGNKLSGSLPEDLGLLLSKLQVVSLAHNDLSGPLPDAWARDMKQLRHVELQYNQLTGPISPEWTKMENAESFNVASNLLTGAIPTEIGLLGTSERDGYPSLLDLFLSNNPGLTGTIPTEIGVLDRLGTLHFSKTSLTGAIPSEIGKLTDLQAIWGDRTKLTGAIPTSIGELSALTHLRLQHSGISGSLPDELFELPELQRLDLWQAKLQGTISPKIGHLASSLNVLRIHNNNLTGEIPTELGLLTNLDTLFLHNNQLQGAIPSQVCGSGSETRPSDDFVGVGIEIGADCLVPVTLDGPAVSCACCLVCCDVTTEVCKFM